MALARGEAAAGVGPGPDPPVLGEFWASRLAFCSSTLGNRTQEIPGFSQMNCVIRYLVARLGMAVGGRLGGGMFV